MSESGKTNPSRPPLIRGGESRHVANEDAKIAEVRPKSSLGNGNAGCEIDDLSNPMGESGSNSSPDKGRLGGVKGFIPYDKRLTALARQNRKNPSHPEIKMWNEVLRMRHFADYKFLRQKPIADFIVDFYCSELRLAIEIDGDSHGESVEYDARRTAILNSLWVSVARYTNEDVMKNIEGVYEDLLNKVAGIDIGAVER